MSNSLPVIDDSKWYSKGLSFRCTGCGKCCTGSPGYTWVSLEEIAEIADFLKLTIDQFAARFLRKIGERYSLKERPVSYDCIFLKEKQCSIYPVRPKQCRTFPWWVENLKSQEAWQEAARHCEGINHPDAELHSQESIDQIVS